jgi:hypothetical protein
LTERGKEEMLEGRHVGRKEGRRQSKKGETLRFFVGDVAVPFICWVFALFSYQEGHRKGGGDERTEGRKFAFFGLWEGRQVCINIYTHINMR